MDDLKKWLTCDINEWLLDLDLYTDDVSEAEVRRLVDRIMDRIKDGK